MPQVPESSKCVAVIKIVNIISALVLIGFGIAGIITLSIQVLSAGKFFLVFSPIFMILFGLMLIAAQWKIKILLQHFGFLASFIGRGVFYIFLASNVFFYFSCGADNNVVAWISGIVIFALGILNIILHFCGGSGYTKQLKEQIV